jgi:hypothetical protein
LDYEKIEEEATDKPSKGEVYYKETDISGGIEGEDKGIVFGAKDEDVQGET